ncbi:DeoR family transcriptional regulator [Mesorhizobium sp. KR1-2]|uniref:DeoR family transcriptional regulator n=1 Tax=Mesorhizobium sp. KR1-2 TaxID=3156609 RepID=UPI0032B3FB70
MEALGAMLKRGGVLRLRYAAGQLGVSEMTIRRDVTQTRDRFTCLGGYIVGVLDGPAGADYSLARESDSHATAKAAACSWKN